MFACLGHSGGHQRTSGGFPFRIAATCHSNKCSVFGSVVQKRLVHAGLWGLATNSLAAHMFWMPAQTICHFCWKWGPLEVSRGKFGRTCASHLDSQSTRIIILWCFASLARVRPMGLEWIVIQILKTTASLFIKSEEDIESCLARRACQSYSFWKDRRQPVFALLSRCRPKWTVVHSEPDNLSNVVPFNIRPCGVWGQFCFSDASEQKITV